MIEFEKIKEELLKDPEIKTLYEKRKISEDLENTIINLSRIVNQLNEMIVLLERFNIDYK